MRYEIIFYVLAGFNMYAQKCKEPDRMKQFSIVINRADETVKTQVLKDAAHVKVHDDVGYLWYTMNTIVETRGGYDGKLLHGYYRAFFMNQQLKESGQLKYGLKTKEWRYWYSNGTLREVIGWKRGCKNGPYKIYNDQGKMMAAGRFKKDVLNGNFYTYDNFGHVVEKKKYKRGIELQGSSGKKIRRWHFNRKDAKRLKTPANDTLKKQSFLKPFFRKKKNAGLQHPGKIDLHANT